jgi:asparagine synthetase B (glutamine-hydrolysing)
MCGIAGFFDTREHRSIPETLLRRMTDAFEKRAKALYGINSSSAQSAA